MKRFAGVWHHGESLVHRVVVLDAVTGLGKLAHLLRVLNQTGLGPVFLGAILVGGRALVRLIARQVTLGLTAGASLLAAAAVKRASPS